MGLVVRDPDLLCLKRNQSSLKRLQQCYLWVSKVTTGDNPSVLITTVKLDGTNYLEWSQLAKMYIGGQGKLAYINGRVVEPLSSDSQAYDKWESKNLTIMS